MTQDILPEEILNKLPLSYYIINLDSYEILNTNNSAVNELKQKCYKSIFGKNEPCYSDNGKCICGQLVEKQESASYIIENVINGSKKFFKASASLISNKKVLVFYENISEITSIQKELKINNKRLERAENLASFGYWEFNIDDNFFFASRGARQIYGFDVAIIKLSEVRECALPEYRADLEKCMTDLITKNEPYDFQFKIKRRSDGEIRFLHSIAEYREDKRMVFGVVHDITKTALAQDALRESEYNMRQLFENMNSAFAFHEIVTDEKGVPVDYIFLDINPKFEELTGLKLNDVINKRVLEVLPETEKFWIDIYGEVALTGNSVSFSEYSGQMNKFFEISAYSPRKKYFAVTFTDITAKVKSERALNESLLDLKMAQQIAKIGSWKYNRVNQTLKWSEQVFKIMERHPDLGPLDFADFRNYLLPDDFKNVKELIGNALVHSSPFEIQLKLVFPENHSKWIEVICQPGDFASGNGNFLRGTVQDITANKKAEEEVTKSNQLLRTVIDNIPDAIYLKDLNYKKLIANREDAIRCGFEKPEELLNKYDTDLYPPEIAKSYLEDDKRVIENGEILIDKEEILPGKNGNRTILTSKIPFKNEKNEIIGLVGIGHDITERKQMINDLVKAKKEAEESNRLKSLFLTNMSHEIRTPLNGILGFSNIICSGLADSAKLEYYGKIIEKSGRRLIKMVDDIIDISMLQSNQMKFNYSSFNLNDLLQDVYSSVSKLYNEQKEIDFSLVKCTDNSCHIFSDKNKIDLILNNLLDNAFKFTTTGKIEFGCFSSDDENLTLFVKDTGVGIAEEKQKVIFEAFRQAEEGDSRKFEGSGVGLAVVSGILEKMGGKIQIQSEPEKGTAFYVTVKKNSMI